MKCSNKKNGFLLIEAAFFICILSVLLSTSIKKMHIIREERSNEITKQNYETIKIAIASFLSKKNRIPHPSNDMLTGIESPITKRGYIPYKTLGIERRVTVDGHGKPIWYIPNIDLTKDFKYINYDKQNNDVEFNEDQYFCHSITSNNLKVRLSDGQTLSEDVVIAFVISSDENHSEHIQVGTSTTWLSRDELLIRYLKTAPCRECKKSQHIVLNDDDDDIF